MKSFFRRLRESTRGVFNKLRKRSAFAAAFMSRLTSDWIFAGRKSADEELRHDLRILRDRARELARNTPFIANFSRLVATNIIGAHGIRLQAKNQTKEGKPYEAANDAIEEAWCRWCQPSHCDARQKMSLTDLLATGVSGWPTDGEILIRFIRGAPHTPFGFAVQLLDPDLLDDEFNQNPVGELPAIRQGVELGAFDAPVAYHLWNRHPDSPGNKKRERISADQILHVFLPTRVGQSRGVPWGASVMQTVKIFDGYCEAVLVAARTAAASPGTIEIADPEKAPGVDTTAGRNDTALEIEPGVYPRLNPGEHLNMLPPTQPTEAFAPFTRTLLHAIAAGLGVSYGTLTGDLSDANYSSMRVGMLAEREYWARLQQFVIVHLLAPIYREWLKHALLNGQIATITDFDATRWCTVNWQPRGFDWIDPLKDVQGELIEVAAGVNTLTRMAAERGRDFYDLVQERETELQWLAEHNVPSQLTTNIGLKPAEEESAPASSTTSKPPARTHLLKASA